MRLFLAWIKKILDIQSPSGLPRGYKYEYDMLKDKRRRPMNNKEIFERLKAAADTEVEQWNKTRLSDIEKYQLSVYYLGGICRAALFVLPTDLYLKFASYLDDKYGYEIKGDRK